MRFVLAAGVLLVADLLLAVWLPAREAGAGTAPRLALTELAREAELIVEARVLAARPLEGSRWLRTEYLLEVARTFKGVDESYRALRLPGGVRPDGSGMLVPGLPWLVPGEELLLFLSAENAEGTRVPTGLSQGKLGLRRAPDGSLSLLADTSALGLVQAGGLEHGGRSTLDYASVVAELEAALGTAEHAR